MATTTAAYDGYFKELYGELENGIPEYSYLSEKIPFREQERLGDSYHFPVRDQRSHGWTFETGANSGTAFTLNAVKSGAMKDASLSGSTFVMRESFAYKAVLSATQAGKQAFGDLFDEGVEDMFNTASAMREICLLYGGHSLGAITANGSSSASLQHTITAVTSSLGMFAQLEGAYVDVYSAVGGTKRNTTGDLEITKVDYDDTAGTVLVTLAGAAADNAAVVAGDLVIPKGADSKWFDGIDKIARNTGTLFGISASTYSIWAANDYSAGTAELTFGKLTKASAQNAMRAGTGTLTALVSIQTWSDLNNNTAALRRLPENKGKVELGAESIVYHGPTGPLEITPHPFVKGGEAFILDLKKFRRVGASDLTFNLGIPGQADRFLRELSDSAGFEIRCLWDLGLICRRPRSMTKITNINNSV
jgi:hypothetical protein